MAEIVRDCIYTDLPEDPWADVTGRCPNPEEHLYINTEKGVFICYRCDASGTLSQLAHDYEDIYGEEFDLDRIKDMDQQSIRDVDLSDPFDEDSEDDDTVTEIPGDVKPLPDGDSLLGRRATTYLKGRGMSELQMDHYDLGYGLNEETGWIYIPIYSRDGSRLVYYIRRAYPWDGVMEQDPPYMNPPNDEVECGKSEIVFNQSRIKKGSAIYVCEGWLDAVNLSPQAVALMGKSMSPTQKRIIVDMEPSSVTVCLDADAHIEAAEIARELKLFADVEIIFLSEGDPGDLDNAGKREALSNTHEYSFQTEINAMLN